MHARECVSPEIVSPDRVSPEIVSPDRVSPESISPESAAPKSVSSENVSVHLFDVRTESRVFGGCRPCQTPA